MLRVGDRIGRYEVTGQLGEGGWGQVLRARDPARGLEVALKVVLAVDHPVARARFLREGRLAAGLSHPNVVRILDVGEIDRTQFIAMELLPGSAMSVHLGSAKVPIQRRLGWLVQAARGLAAVHDAGLVHRDVKPANLMITPDDVVKLIDFGFAKTLDPSDRNEALTQRGAIVGTPAYMAPEQNAGSAIDPRADQFAWGLTGFALVTGTRLRADGSILPEPPALERRLLEGGVTPAVAGVLLRAVRLAREERFASMHEAGDAVLAAIPGISAERAPALFCPRCATELDAHRRCPRCDAPETAPRLALVGGSRRPPAAPRGERARWRFEARRPALALTLEVAHLQRDGLVVGFTSEGQGLVLAPDGILEIPPPPVTHAVRCLTTSSDGALWVGTAGGEAARLYAGVWSLVQRATEEESLVAAALGPDGGVCFAGSCPRGGVLYLFARARLRARHEAPVVIRGVVGTEDGRAFGVGGASLFRASEFGMGTVETLARGPLAAIARWHGVAFAVGEGGSAFRWEPYQTAVPLDAAETRAPFSHVCAAGIHLAYAIAGNDDLLRRDPGSRTWQKIGGAFGEGRSLAIAGTEEAVTLVMNSGAILHGRRT